jgi:hypothetical protein
MIDDKHMNTIRAVREKLRGLTSSIDEITHGIDEDVCLLPERLWWSEIEDEHHAVAVSLEEVADHIDEALSAIAEITGEDEPELANFMPPLPLKMPSKDEVFAARRDKAVAIRAQRGDAS